jgi:4-amino-4-deoxy-L-arabinose transferase-like glycosyltransferase
MAIGISLVLLIVITLVLGSVPPISRDALTHHLAVPKIWIEKGLFTELPAIPFSYYPMNLDLLYMIPLYFGNDIIPKYIHFAFALFTAFLIFSHLKRRLNGLYGLLGALFFLSLPVIVKLSTTVYVDLGLIFFSTAALLNLIYWFENGHRNRYLIYSAIWCGFALGTKYNGLIVLFLLSCFVPILYLRRLDGAVRKKSWRSQLAALGLGAIFMCIALLVFSPWMAKNIHMTGNPLHPLYGSYFKNSSERQPLSDVENTIAVEKETAVPQKNGWKNFAVRKIAYGEPLWQICLIPLRVFFEGRDDDPKHFDGQLNPFLLLLPLMLLLPGNRADIIRRGEYRILALFAIGYIIFVFFQVDMRIRWISPIIPPLIILSMFGLERIYSLGRNSNVRWKRLFFKGVVVITTFVMLFINARYIQFLWDKVDPLPFITGKESRGDYINRFRPEYELIKHINQHLPGDAVILCLFIGNRIYYFDRPIRWNVNLLEKVVTSSKTIDDIRYGLKKAEITHLMIRYDLTNAWANAKFDQKKQALLKLFLEKRVKQIQSYGGYGLYEIQGKS